MVAEAAHHRGDLRLDRRLARAELRRFRGGHGKPGELAPEGAVGEQEGLHVRLAGLAAEHLGGDGEAVGGGGAEVYIVIS